LNWKLKPAPFELRFRVEHAFGDRAPGNLAAPTSHGLQSVAKGFRRAVSEWKTEFSVRMIALFYRRAKHQRAKHQRATHLRPESSPPKRAQKNKVSINLEKCLEYL